VIVFPRVPILGLILVLLLVPTIVLADPIRGNQLEIQGAHIVSEGAYFRFLMVNHYGVPIYVTINDGDPIYLPTNGSANYNVIAPQISMSYQVVTYSFKQYYNSSLQDQSGFTIDFPVTVVAYNFVEFILATNIIIAIGLFVFIISFIIWHRRQSHGRSAR
jgi:hypothetical protein